MTTPEIASLYFDLSNKSDFANIAKLFTNSTTYSSQNTGIYLGANAIIEMQKQFHRQFSVLNWKVNSIEEVKSGVVCLDYTFTGTKLDGGQIESSGIEYVIVQGGKILHIEIKNKP